MAKIREEVQKMDLEEFRQYLLDGLGTVILQREDRLADLWDGKDVDVSVTLNIMSAVMAVVEYGLYGKEAIEGEDNA